MLGSGKSSSTRVAIRAESTIVSPVSSVLDHQAFLGQHRIALAENKSDSPERRDKAVGFRLAVRDIFSRDDIEKQAAQFRAPEYCFGFGAQCPGRDHQRKSIRAVAHETLRARIYDVALGEHRAVNHALPRDQAGEMRFVHVFVMPAQYLREAIVIVESNQPRKVVAAHDLDFLFNQSFVEGRKMQYLGFGSRSIEIEYHVANHVREALPA